MSADLLCKVRVVSLVLLLPLHCLVSEANPRLRPPEEDALQPGHSDELLEILDKAEKASSKGKVLEDFQKHPKAQRLSTLAYALKERKHTHAALQAILIDPEMNDCRLAPFLVETIKTAKDHELLLSARVAMKLSDPVLLAPLIENALESEYFEVDTCTAPNGTVEFVYNSVFAEAAEAIYRITNGKIGKERVSRNHIPINKRNTELIKEWKIIWAEAQNEKEEKE
jgi:hypothetical protein